MSMAEYRKMCEVKKCRYHVGRCVNATSGKVGDRKERFCRRHDRDYHNNVKMELKPRA